MATTLTINGEQKSFDAPADMPLLWVLRDILGMTGTKFGCGIAQCGACTVHIDGKPVRSCVLPVGAVRDRAITTIEGIGASRRRKGAKSLARSGSDPVRLLPVRPDHAGRGAARGHAAILTIPISMQRWRETSAVAEPMCGSAPRSSRPRRTLSHRGHAMNRC